MADIEIEDISDEVVEALTRRARSNGRSLNDEAVAILIAAATQGLEPVLGDEKGGS